MNPKDIIETVPLSAIRKVIELDAQDARELKTLAIEMREALNYALQTLGAVPPNPIRAAVMMKIQIVLQKAEDIL